MIQVNVNQQIGVILAHKSEILHMVIQDGMSEDTSPRERLAIYKTLDELVGVLRSGKDG